ncbi:diguanylate cyclase/phosphodiesterase with PAS/PAC sensor(s) [Piscinibacter sakaiensis]|uniref:Diguanylate cyclase/phosphodiesterase with PAS/PAC sensor(S) n=2 Tax=Piscinibacter sakaiensis TaxID=1547922 RepID=A0A0K8P4I2_PISS1|nr:diguanylate cyclase/phosphodiesterase with PAS/PAC sensor(s) [Piscinibacter sakaiensis]
MPDPAAPDRRIRLDPVASGAVADGPWPPARLLVVDDEPRLRTSLAELLAARGHAVAVAGDARAAMRQLDEGGFDLVLLDLRLPDLGGHAVMDHINQRGQDVGVIVVSGESDINAPIGALKRGADDYVRKPYAMPELLKSIDHTLQRRRLLAENRRMAARLEHSERLYRHLVDSSPDVIYTLDPQGCFTFVNDRFESLLGVDRHSLIGQHFSALVHEEDRDRAFHVFNERRCGERASRNVELRMRPPAGRRPGAGGAAGVPTLLFNSIGMYAGLGGADGAANDAQAAPVYSGTYGVARDITERKRAEETISYQAYHDVLTDLPNRILFRDRLDVAMLQAMRSGTELAVMFIDLDRFKLVNDTLGHMRGDDLLKQAAGRLKDSLRRGDTLARLGGDEFVIMLPRLGSREDAAVVARKCLECLQLPFTLGDQEVLISASIGIAVFPADGQTIDQLLAHADIAMYRVKGDGKNGHCFFHPDMLDASHEKLSLGKGLRQALDQGELEMYYQPQVDVRTGRIVGAEGLMRWNHPQRGLLTAGEFLPFAEEGGLILPISDWMLQTVCRDLASWSAVGADDVVLALNLSPQYLERGEFVQKLTRAQAHWGFRMSRIEVEITENISIRNPQYVIEQLNGLCRLGVSVAIDDFGTGYSSLAYLHRFPVRTVKIDQSFVREIQHVNGHCPVVLAIIAMASGLGMNLVAEGVETPDQSQYLEQAGCTRMQGFLFHPPMRAADFLQLLHEQSAGRRPAAWLGQRTLTAQGQLSFGG